VANRALHRYLVLQAPGWALLACLAWLLPRWLRYPAWIGWAVLAGWLVKDLLLFPFVRSAYLPAGDAAERLVGARAVTAERIDPYGYVRIGSELWRAEISRGAPPVEPGRPVTVVRVDGLTLVVAEDDPTGHFP
jgi:membrane protein implicated in regulation of membrane protease activity